MSLLSPFFFIAPLAFSSSPSHSLLIRERLILCSCCQQEPLSSSSQIHSQDDSPLLMSALKPTPPPFTCPSLCSPPLSPCSEPSHLPPLMCPPCMLFSLIPGFHFFPSHVMGYYFLGCKMVIWASVALMHWFQRGYFITFWSSPYIFWPFFISYRCLSLVSWWKYCVLTWWTQLKHLPVFVSELVFLF